MHEFIVQIAQKSGAAQAAPAAPLPTALYSPKLLPFNVAYFH